MPRQFRRLVCAVSIVSFLLCSATLAHAAGTIVVTGSAARILNGDLTPAEYNNTDIGNVYIDNQYAGQDLKTIPIVISNVGNSTLTLDTYVFTGINADRFGMQFSSYNPILEPGQSIQVRIRASPGAAGVKNATLTINSSDSVTPAYSFAIRATGIEQDWPPLPDMEAMKTELTVKCKEKNGQPVCKVKGSFYARNLTTIPSAKSTVEIFACPVPYITDEAELIATKNLKKLGAYKIKKIKFAHKREGYPEGTWYIFRIDASELVDETNEQNNTLTSPAPLPEI